MFHDSELGSNKNWKLIGCCRFAESLIGEWQPKKSREANRFEALVGTLKVTTGPLGTHIDAECYLSEFPSSAHSGLYDAISGVRTFFDRGSR
jgi:hypothetical protein